MTKKTCPTCKDYGFIPDSIVTENSFTYTTKVCPACGGTSVRQVRL